MRSSSSSVLYEQLVEQATLLNVTTNVNDIVKAIPTEPSDFTFKLQPWSKGRCNTVHDGRFDVCCSHVIFGPLAFMATNIPNDQIPVELGKSINLDHAGHSGEPYAMNTLRWAFIDTHADFIRAGCTMLFNQCLMRPNSYFAAQMDK